MKEEWLMSGAMVPVDMETTAALVAEIKRLIDVVGGMALAQSEQDCVGWFGYDTGLRLWFENKSKRPVAYAKVDGAANSKWYSRSMGLLGTLLLLFLIFFIKIILLLHGLFNLKLSTIF